MKVIDRSTTAQTEQGAGRMNGWIRAMRMGETLSKDLKAQDDIVKVLQQRLGNRFFLLRNINLEGVEIPIPFILVGPPGIRIINPSSLQGVFRAKAEMWERLDDNRQIFRAAKPNLIAQVSAMTNAVSEHLDGFGFERMPMEPVLIFADPGTHVDQVRPVVRIVLMDAIDRFTSQLVQSQPLLSVEQVQEIVSILDPGQGDAPDEVGFVHEQDEFSFQDVRSGRTRSRQPTVIEQRINGLMGRLNRVIPFSGRQWLVLGLMVLVNVILLTAFVIYILLTA